MNIEHGRVAYILNIPRNVNVTFSTSGAFTSPGATTGTGTNSVTFGTGANTFIQVQFSTTQQLAVDSKGQAEIDPVGTNAITNLTISVPGGSFTDLIINPEIIGNNQPTPGPLTVTAITTGGNQSFTYNLGNGQNFLTIIATGSTRITSVTLSAAAGNGFTDLEQPRISGAALNPTTVPEPTTMLLFGTGLAGLGAVARRRRNIK